MRKIMPFLCPTISLAVLLLLWDFSVRLFAIPDYLLPGPAAVFLALYQGFADASIWPHIAATLSEIALGYTFGSLLAIALGIVLAESTTFERFVYPLLVALQAMPKVALGPIILVWCGFGIASKVVLVTLVCFFPLFVNTVNGIRRTDNELLDTCRAFSASKVYLLIHVKLPSAASEIFFWITDWCFTGVNWSRCCRVFVSSTGFGIFNCLQLRQYEPVNYVFWCVAIGGNRHMWCSFCKNTAA